MKRGRRRTIWSYQRLLGGRVTVEVRSSGSASVFSGSRPSLPPGVEHDRCAIHKGGSVALCIAVVVSRLVPGYEAPNHLTGLGVVWAAEGGLPEVF